uniref:Secreted protein n=1 Tax=Schistocephalus solidus TaxID=70667 RepID=A0A0X3NI92_SCHSO
MCVFCACFHGTGLFIGVLNYHLFCAPVLPDQSAERCELKQVRHKGSQAYLLIIAWFRQGVCELNVYFFFHPPRCSVINSICPAVRPDQRHTPLLCSLDILVFVTPRRVTGNLSSI